MAAVTCVHREMCPQAQLSNHTLERAANVVMNEDVSSSVEKITTQFWLVKA